MGAEAPPQEQSLSEEQVEAQVRARQAARKAKEAEGAEDMSADDVMKVAAHGARSRGEVKLTDEQIHDALEVFFATEDDEGTEIEPQDLRLNVGDSDDPKWIKWTVVPIDDDVIQKIRKISTTGSKAQRRRGEAETDEALVARRIVAKATVEPDIRALAQRLDIKTDPADAVLKYFRKFGKTGLIIQLSGKILEISGYDEDAISDLDAASG